MRLKRVYDVYLKLRELTYIRWKYRIRPLSPL